MGKRILIAGDAGTYRRYGEAVRNAGAIAVFWDAQTPDGDALLLPGGGDLDPRLYGQENTASRNLDPARDRREWELLETFTAAGKPVLGICRGMQSVNVFFGGTLAQDVPGHGKIRGEDRIHKIRSAPGIFTRLWGKYGKDDPARFTVNSAHHQAVDRMGSGLAAQQWAEDGVIEALRHTRLPVWGVQWHPERLNAPAGSALFAAFMELLTEKRA